MIHKTINALLLCAVAGFSHAANQDDPSLKAEIEQLKKQNRDMNERLDAAMNMLEKSSSSPHRGGSNVHIGGYGELHYNNLENQLSGGADKEEIDFHRFVLMFGYDFNDTIRFFSELELEHALADDSGKGEVELEQAYIEMDLSESQQLKAGVFLIPVGILNETHEPTTFYGVERNSVESNIIPSTWWEAGAMYTHRFENALSLDVSIHSGLNTSSGSNYAVRSGRQKVAKARAADLAYTARLKWTGAAGLELAATLQHQNDVTQGNDSNAGSATLIETHAIWQSGPFSMRVLYAKWDLDGTGPAAVGADEQKGYYLEPSYRLTDKLGVFARYSQWDNQASDATDSEISQIDLGLNYWPHENVVFKIDLQDQDTPSGSNELDGFNLGVGYYF